MKLWLSLLIMAFLMPLFTEAQILKREKGEKKYGPKEEKADDEYLAKLDPARICFTKTGKDGREWVAIRLTPGQYRFASARAKVKKLGVVRVLLRPRQINLLQKAAGDEYRWSKVELRISAKRLNKIKGLKDRYVVRLLSQFKKKGDVFKDDDDADENVDKDIQESVDKGCKDKEEKEPKKDEEEEEE